MTVDAATVERVRRVLEQRPEVVERRMVGGRSFLLEGRMFCGVVESSLMVRLGPRERDRALRRPHVRPMTMGGRELGGFLLVDPEGIATDAALRSWVQCALEHVAGLRGESRG